MTRVGRTLIALTAALAALPAATAAAGTVGIEGSVLVVNGTPGIDELDIENAGNTEFVNGDNVPSFTVLDRRNVLEPLAGCEQGDSPNEVSCRFPEGTTAPQPTSYRIDAGAGNDLLVASQFDTLPGTLLGGPGDDMLGGGGGVDSLDGGDGNDVLKGDENYEGSGSNSRKAADDVRGGPGTDRFSYSGHEATSIVASLDDQPNDGQPGEGDNVRSDVENLDGDFNGSGNTLTGSDAPNELTGAGASDALSGGGGNDRLIAFGGNDRLDGGAGDDFLEGGFDDDALEGGPGTDSFVGDETRSNTIGTGNDTISARDGLSEPVSCGPGADRATVDANDVVATDPQNGCETVDRAAGPPPGGGGGGGGGSGGGGAGGGGGGASAAFPLAVSGSTLKVSRSGRVTVRLKCLVTDAAGCNGTLKLASTRKVRVGGKRRTLSLGSKSFSVAPGKTARVVFKLSRANRTAVRRLKRVALRLTATECAATPRTFTKTLTLRR